MIQEHKEERETVENDAWEEIDKLKEKNKEELAKQVDAGMKAKGDLTLITNQWKEFRQ
eukprot:CAMPEP_0116883662 /NCGR_PEP_ID=MMETSP0463-20121206/16237_1 /TAXON_ID=181622 /ORGANISM="Strombidinopsis sp, Strain SopsisLIS2011" /LENGTH=57 /DNA_ID=CAMNT_0004538757 /DNA_START=2438 /DNA_END=2611 /DNA_ORIENTATION=-